MRAVVLLLLALLWPVSARAAEPLVADLSDHLVAITTGFTGSDVLLFGAVDAVGDVVVVVRGPPQQEVVRRKEHFLNLIWLNRGQARADVPSFYWVGATRSLSDIADPAVFEPLRVGLEHLPPAIRTKDERAEPADYWQALIRLKQERGLFYQRPGEVTFLGDRLFRATLHFPANVPVGTYSVEVYLLRGGEVLSAQTTPLIISKVGVGADVYDFAHQHGALYGIAAILLATLAGWAAAQIFRKG